MSLITTRHPHRPHWHHRAAVPALLTLRLVALATAVASFGAALVAVVEGSSRPAGTSLAGDVELLVALTLLAAPLTLGGSVVLAARLSGVARPAGRRPRLVPAAMLMVALTSAALLATGWTIGPSMALAAVGSFAFGTLVVLPIDRAQAATTLATLDALAGVGVAASGILSGAMWLVPVGALLELAAVLLAWPRTHAGTLS